MNTKSGDDDDTDSKSCININTNMADLLQEKHQDGDQGSSLLFQTEERPRCSDKQLGVSICHVVLETVVGDDSLHGLSVRGHQVVRPGVLTCHFIPARRSGGERGSQGLQYLIKLLTKKTLEVNSKSTQSQ